MLFQETRIARLERVAIEGTLLNRVHFTLPFVLILIFEIEHLETSFAFEFHFVK